MLRKMHIFFNSAWLAGVLAALLIVTPALAATPTPATGMTGATGPLPGWVEVEPGAVQWYRFKYSYDAGEDEDDPFQAIVDLQMAAPANLTFEVWTPARLNAPLPDPNEDEQEGMVREPVGMGTPEFVETTWHWEGIPRHRHYVDRFDPTHLIWAGAATATETYYIVVKNKGAETASYQLSISGPTVSF
jgi:hypothetical protein